MTAKTKEPPGGVKDGVPAGWDRVPTHTAKARRLFFYGGYDVDDLDTLKADILSGKLTIRSIRNYGKETHEYVCKQLGIPVYFHPRLVWSCNACGLQGKQSDFMHHQE